MTRVVVHIERLVLQGFRPPDGEAIAAGLQAELSRTLAGPAAARNLIAMGSVPRLQLPALAIDHRMTSQRVGERVGHGIGREFER